MLRIMRPAVAAASIAGRGLSVVNVLPVGVIHECIVIVYVYSIVTAPPTVVTPAPAPSRSHGHSNAEG